MLYVVIGCIAFAFLYIFDLNKLISIHRALNISFACGVFLLTLATYGIVVTPSPGFWIGSIWKVTFGLLTMAAFSLMIYSLFFALPFRKTYVAMDKIQLVNTGMWALCRHVGVLWFFFMYLFLWLATGKLIVLYAGITWTILDIVHVYMQDRWIFPQTLPGYDKYKREVPFLIPNRKSIRKCLNTLR
jgi:protein-S-isoprenylcysteine O-methyltransferase Ste14